MISKCATGCPMCSLRFVRRFDPWPAIRTRSRGAGGRCGLAPIAASSSRAPAQSLLALEKGDTSANPLLAAHDLGRLMAGSFRLASQHHCRPPAARDLVAPGGGDDPLPAPALLDHDHLRRPRSPSVSGGDRRRSRGLCMGCGDAPRGCSAEFCFVSCAGGSLVGSFGAADRSGGANEERVQSCALVLVEAGEDLVLD